jgi:predicted CxxxxCH...CXXCH cytochrome family protein
MTMRRALHALAALLLFAPLVTLADDHGKRRGREREHEEEEDDDGHGEGASRSRASAAALRATPQWKAYANECGSCHLAFPPQLLPARSWRALAAGLGDHFGQNAEVDAKALAPLESFLVANAGKDPGGPVPLRITGLSWWQREHRKIDPSVFARKAVTSAANCAACHPGANEGAFGEKQVKIPRDAPAAR